MIREAVRSSFGEVSIDEVLKWIRLNYRNDDVKRNTISKTMSQLCINGPPSSRYPDSKKFLYRVGRGIYREFRANV
jgi:hypothetical protein